MGISSTSPAAGSTGRMAKLISNIVFTKNRPLQLHGYLESLRRSLPAEAIQTDILYKPELFDSEYDYCFSQFPNCRIVRETDFHYDLLNIIEQVDTPYVLFGIDDVVYFDSVPLDLIEKTFADLGGDLLGFSLRLDKRQMPDDFAAGNVRELSISGRRVYSADWTKGLTSGVYYPFELCATVYRTQDVRAIVAGTMKGGAMIHKLFAPSSGMVKVVGKVYPRRKLLKFFGFFFNPNTFESWCCRYVQRHPEQFGRLLAFEKICAGAIQVNMVNTSTANQWDDSAELTVEALAEKYKQGWRIDINALETAHPLGTHSGREYFRIIQRQNRV